MTIQTIRKKRPLPAKELAAMYDVSEGLKKEPLDQIRIETR